MIRTYARRCVGLESLECRSRLSFDVRFASRLISSHTKSIIVYRISQYPWNTRVYASLERVTNHPLRGQGLTWPRDGQHRIKKKGKKDVNLTSVFAHVSLTTRRTCTTISGDNDVIKWRITCRFIYRDASESSGHCLQKHIAHEVLRERLGQPPKSKKVSG